MELRVLQYFLAIVRDIFFWTLSAIKDHTKTVASAKDNTATFFFVEGIIPHESDSLTSFYCW